MSNWWNVIKQNKLVNLPKFKVKPFNTPKPNEEDTRCKDKIMEIANFTENFQFPNEIGQEFVKVKKETTYYGNEITYGGKKLNAKLHASVNVVKREASISKEGDFNSIPEEVFCRLLDMLSGANFKYKDEDNVGGTGYRIMAVKLRNTSGIQQDIEIRNDIGIIVLWVGLQLFWSEWSDYKLNEGSNVQTLFHVDGKQSEFIDEELSKLADEMRWPI